MRTGKIQSLLKGDGMLLVSEQQSTLSVKVSLNAAKPGWWISLILMGFKLGSKIVMHARWTCDEDYCTRAKFHHKIQFHCKSRRKRHYSKQKCKPNWYFSLVHKNIGSSNCHMSLSYTTSILTNVFTYTISNYLSSPEMTFFPLPKIQLFCSCSLPLVSTYVGRDWLDCTKATAKRNFWSGSDSHPTFILHYNIQEK